MISQVFVMRGTGEVFTDYEKYLKRCDCIHSGFDGLETDVRVTDMTT